MRCIVLDLSVTYMFNGCAANTFVTSFVLALILSLFGFRLFHKCGKKKA